jgi:hypothetical protein
LNNEPNPAAVLAVERELADEVRQLGRQVAEHVYNQLEPAEPESLPHDVHYEAGDYRRLNHKTPNREVATLFGKITLWRHGYRYVERNTGEPTIFPLEIQLSLVEGALPRWPARRPRPWPKRGPRKTRR